MSLYVSSMTVNDSAVIPDQAQRISKKHAWAGFDADGELCCLFGGAELVVWARKDTRSSVATASLPYPVSHAVASIVAVQVDLSTNLDHKREVTLQCYTHNAFRRWDLRRLLYALQTAMCPCGRTWATTANLCKLGSARK